MFINSKKDPEFWIVNISKRDVSLGDLALTIRAGTSINLLDKRHYHLSKEQIDASVANGSIFKKGMYVKIRKVPPTDPIKQVIQVYQGERVGRVERPTIKVETPEYEELNFSEEQAAQDDLAAGIEEEQAVIIKK